jgi:hypothetical protein
MKKMSEFLKGKQQVTQTKKYKYSDYAFPAPTEKVREIKSLTPEQEAAMQPWAEMKIAEAVSTDPVNHAIFEENVAKCYRFAGFEPPPVYWLASPWAGAIAISLLQNETFLNELLSATGRKKPLSRAGKIPGLCNTQPFVSAFEVVCRFLKEHGVTVNNSRLEAAQFSDLDVSAFSKMNYSKAFPKGRIDVNAWTGYFGGYFWAGWPAYERFFAEVCGLELEGDFTQRGEACALACANSGWFWVYDEICIATEKHVSLKRDAQHRLHSEHGPAISWADGFGVSCLQGVVIPPEWTARPKGEGIDVRLGLTWENVEQRRVLREMLGWQRILEAYPVKVIDKHEDPQVGSLLELDLGDDDGRPARFLQAQCGTGRTIVERVDPLWGNSVMSVQEKRWGVEPGGYSLEVRT